MKARVKVKMEIITFSNRRYDTLATCLEEKGASISPKTGILNIINPP
jgi:hypothetical protein